MLNVVLFEPEIPPNTGNIIRLCANAGARLHLIKPYGFELGNRYLKRAGLDYHDLTELRQYDGYENFVTSQKINAMLRIIACSTKGKTSYADINYADGDFLLFGPETRGLPQTVLENYSEDRIANIPMRVGNRSLNLSNAVAVILYEAWRQLGFAAGL